MSASSVRGRVIDGEFEVVEKALTRRVRGDVARPGERRPAIRTDMRPVRRRRVLHGRLVEVRRHFSVHGRSKLDIAVSVGNVVLWFVAAGITVFIGVEVVLGAIWVYDFLCRYFRSMIALAIILGLVFGGGGCVCLKCGIRH